MTTNSPRRRPSEPPRDAPVCCGRRMLLRFNRSTGAGFYGCWRRECRRTLPANVREPDWFGKGGAK